ncbi:hypothetical protein BTE48_02225 [Oceanospirillum multiglobuliferum]|uniref:Tryptophan synthase beta chain-like PALP domain-containing protein n=2 Tax=Oceanospirillum multiglobuliferum TaxID=64969 RepID=A0A1V4T9Z9_9GAMM|nr:hypothetical protein BTE48_02225 [Oceanospirillum multiglobuliferum]
MTVASVQALEQQLQPPVLQAVQHPLLTEHQVQLWFFRTDLVDPIISGNKWFKLKYNLVQALQQKAAGVLSFGGAWSNHLHALAAACEKLALPVTAIIRGEPELIGKSLMLQEFQQMGGQLHFVSRSEYRERENPSWLAKLQQQYPNYFLVPEGGSSAYAEQGLLELAYALEVEIKTLALQPNQIWCALGTGGTFAGLLSGRTLAYELIGVPVLKGGHFLAETVQKKLQQSVVKSPAFNASFNLLLDGHRGGYGKADKQYLAWMEHFTQQTGVPLDPIYTGKLCYRFFQALEQGSVVQGSQVVLLHTGGLQGRRGYDLSWPNIGGALLYG